MANQAQVVSWLEANIPEINATQDPEGTLLKFARVKNLAEAQLQKLGHVYNTAKTLSYLDKNPDNRGGNFKVMDVDAMLEKYASSNLQKAASVEVGPVLEVVMDRMPNLFPTSHMAEDKLVTEIDTNFHIIKRAYTEQSYSKKNRESVEQIIFETEQDITNGIAKVATLIRQNPYADFEIAHADVWFVKGASAGQTVTDIVGYLNRVHHVQVKQAEDAGIHRLVNTEGIEKNIYDALVDVCDHRCNLKAANQLLEDFSVSEVAGFGPKTAEDKFPQVGLKKKSLDKQAAPTMGFGFDTTIKERTATRPFYNPHTQKVEDRKETSAETTRSPQAQPKSEPEGPSMTEKVVGAEAGAIGARKSIWDSIRAPYTMGRNPHTVLPVPKILQDLMPNLEGKSNDKQRSVDDAYASAKQEALFNTLMLNDPILSNLSDEDEEMVTDAYNSIVSIAPNIASDKNTIRPWLRQVTEFGGITPLEMKNLLEMEREYLKLKRESEQTANDTYSIGGKQKQTFNTDDLTRMANQ